MEAVFTNHWVYGCALTLLVGLFAGYLIGGRKATKRRRKLQQALNAQSLELLDVRTEHRQLSQFIGAASRKDRLLKLALIKLKAGNVAVSALQQQQTELERRHFIEMSRLNVSAVEAKQRAKRAAAVARESSFRLRLLERALPQFQTITAHEPKSYGQGEAVTVSVVDKKPPAATREQANAVSHRDLHRLASMKPVNEHIRERPDNTVTFQPSGPARNKKSNKPDASEQSLHKNSLR